MRIGIDIDETIAATFQQIIPHVAKVCNASFVWEDCTHHDMWNIPQLSISRDEAIRIWDAWWEIEWHLVPPVIGSVEKIALLKDSGHELFVITARNEEKYRNLTENWIEKFFPKIFEDVHFTSIMTSTPKTKSSVCKELDIPLMVDDNIDYALELADNDVVTILLEKPWNKHRTETHKNLVRVKDWNEIPDLISAHAKSFS